MAQEHEHYDAVRYPGHFYPQSSPDRLAALGTLHGLAVAPVTAARVLELGVGDGGNLIPVAEHFPGSRFLGIDSSAKAIEDGQRTIAALGLGNIDLVAGDILAFEPEPESFDYVICHGVLSWVPEPVREKILATCRKALAPHGVAYVSYDTLPGGYVKSITRDLVRFHTRRIGEQDARLRAARDVVEFVAQALAGSPMEREFFRREIAPYEGKDYFLFHDLLASVDDPLYFLDFMDAATRHGLRFVSEANPESMRTTHLPEPVQQRLNAIPDRLEREQYLDFINLRRFRQTLLCRAERSTDLEVTPERLERLLITTPARPAGPPPGPARASADAGPVEFATGPGPRLRLEEPRARAMILSLSEARPRGLRYSELRAATCQRMGVDPASLAPEDDGQMIRFLVASHANGLVQLQAHQYEYLVAVSERPAVTPLTRHLAARGEPVVSRRLETFYLSGQLLPALVPLLDGSRDLEALLVELAATPGARRGLTEAQLRRALEMLCGNALLVG